jgi:hypothetical protein
VLLSDSTPDDFFAVMLRPFAAFLSREDIIVSDQLNHASILDGCRLSRAEIKIFPHKDIAACENILKEIEARKCRKLLITGILSHLFVDNTPRSPAPGAFFSRGGPGEGVPANPTSPLGGQVLYLPWLAISFSHRGDTITTDAKAREHLQARFEAAYPFHPATISVFQRKWQALPHYQRTHQAARAADC